MKLSNDVLTFIVSFIFEFCDVSVAKFSKISFYFSILWYSLKSVHMGDIFTLNNNCRPMPCSTGVGSMGAPGAGAPMKFLSGIQCHTSL